MLTYEAQENIADLRNQGASFTEIREATKDGATHAGMDQETAKEIHEFCQKIETASAIYPLVEVDGIKYQIVVEAYHACRPDNDDWEADAIRISDGKECKVVWNQINADCEDASEACDWKNPYNAYEI